MNKTKRVFVAAFMAVVCMMSAMFAGCSTSQPTVGVNPKHAHPLVKVEGKGATCTEEGNVEHYVCYECDKFFADEEGRKELTASEVVKVKSHQILKHNEKSATCMTAGNRAYWECRWCHALFADAEGKVEISAPATLPKADHVITKVDAKEPSGYIAGWVEHYTCTNCQTLYKDAAGLQETTIEEVTVFGQEFDYKIAFTPAANIESINGNATAYISAAYTTATDGMPATQYTFKAGATTGMEVEAWINSVVNQTMANGQNLRIPTFSGTARNLELIVTNDGGQSVSFRYYAENYGDKGGVDVTIAPGETKTVTFSVNPGSSIGCNYALKVLGNVNTETKITMHGYFACEGEVNGINIMKDASDKTFKVGESFSSDGLVVKANGTNYDEVIISNYMTNIAEGYVFTASDIGTKTVLVSFGELTTSYTVTVTA